MSLAGAVEQDLRAAGVGEVRADTTTRAAHSSDASLYRVMPLLVVRPRTVAEVAATLEVCRARGVPLTSRGAGTSIAGNAVGTGVLIDFSRHLNKVVSLDPQARTAVVQPGVIAQTLQAAAAPHGLRFGPDPSSHTRCTVGGMIGNNACGSRALRYGRTSDNVLGLRALTGTGTALDLPADAEKLSALRGVVGGALGVIRTEFASFGRQVSGYALEHLLPENGFDLVRFLVGSEGTLAVTTEATVALVAQPRHRVLVVLGYPDIATAAEHAPEVATHGPTACEGIDARIVDVVRARRGAAAVPPLPAGSAWLFVELAGEEEDEVIARAQVLVRSANDTGITTDVVVVTDPAQSAALWRIREDGAGLSARSPAGRPAHAGWEDSAVPPDRLGAYVREFETLMVAHKLTGVAYGHFADGCLHVRLDFPLDRPGGTARFREFVDAAATLVAGYGGSLSGEHGDGRARSALLAKMYSAEALGVFEQVKAVFDPEGILNPGILVDPRPVKADLRVPAAPRVRANLALSYAADGGDFGQAVHRCTGVGRCRADNTADGGVMCPSYVATREEKDSTRGRARVLQEMINGTTVSGGWRSPEVHEALDLCLSCKGCLSDCPTGVDMAAYKAEVLHQSYRRRRRPAAHYALGWLPRWAQMASRSPRLVNTVLGLPPVARAAKRAGGLDERRNVPAFAPQTFRQWFDHRPIGIEGDPVLLFVDSFTNHFTPEVGQATVAVLEDAGYRVRLTERQECCGLTWISTGQLDAARRILGRTVAALTPIVETGIPIVGMEPSCTATLRSDAPELLGANTAGAVVQATHTLAELLAKTEGWHPPDLQGQRIVAQPHCHHHAVMGWSRDAQLLDDAGATVSRLGGCCGLAGNFGVEQGHYDVSVAIAEHQLVPAVRDAGADDVVLADGYSCRTQIDDLTHRHGRHLAQLLAQHLGAPTQRDA